MHLINILVYLTPPIINSASHLGVIEKRLRFIYLDGSSRNVFMHLGSGKVGELCLSYLVKSWSWIVLVEVSRLDIIINLSCKI